MGPSIGQSFLVLGIITAAVGGLALIGWLIFRPRPRRVVTPQPGDSSKLPVVPQAHWLLEDNTLVRVAVPARANDTAKPAEEVPTTPVLPAVAAHQPASTPAEDTGSPDPLTVPLPLFAVNPPAQKAQPTGESTPVAELTPEPMTQPVSVPELATPPTSADTRPMPVADAHDTRPVPLLSSGPLEAEAQPDVPHPEGPEEAQSSPAGEWAEGEWAEGESEPVAAGDGLADDTTSAEATPIEAEWSPPATPEPSEVSWSLPATPGPAQAEPPGVEWRLPAAPEAAITAEIPATMPWQSVAPTPEGADEAMPVPVPPPFTEANAWNDDSVPPLGWPSDGPILGAPADTAPTAWGDESPRTTTPVPALATVSEPPTAWAAPPVETDAEPEITPWPTQQEPTQQEPTAQSPAEHSPAVVLWQDGSAS